jgi:hypothetical protein
LEERYDRGELVVELNDKWSEARVCLHETNSKAAKRHEKRYNLIKPLVRGENEVEIFIPRIRGERIEKRATDCVTTRQTISALLKLYWKRGMTFNALRTDLHKCGNGGKRRNPLGGKKVGRPRWIKSGVGLNVNDEVRKKFKSGVDYYLSRKKPSIQDAHDKIIGLYFSSRVEAANGKTEVVLFPDNERPTRRQFRYFLENDESYRNRRIRREGQKQWDLHERPMPGTNTGDVQGPGDRFQVDATIADVYLLSQFDRRRIVGRPVIYFVIDVFSRLITGVYVGFEGPSWIGAMMVLVNMVTPKADYCRQIGLNDFDPKDWPSAEASKTILADRGELASVELGKNITDKLGLSIENASPGRADLKALVERRFGIVPAKFKQFASGYVEPDAGERGAPDYRIKATMNLSEFTEMVVLAVIEHNNEPISKFETPHGMIVDGLSPTPVNLWNWGIRHRSGALKRISVEEMMLNVMPMEKAKVTPHGIKFKGAYYSSATALRKDWFALARRKTWDVDVSFDPRDLGTVYLRNLPIRDCPNGYEACSLRPRSVEYQGKSIFEAEELAYQNKVNIAAGEDDRQAKRIKTDDKMEKIESKAKKATKALGPETRSNAQRTSGIGDNHADEKLVQRETEKFAVGNNPGKQSPPYGATTETTKQPKEQKKSLLFLDVLRQERAKRAGGNDEQEVCG